MKGRINSIQTLGTLDGPGVRFVVFMQGCPLRCAYCHNPDTWDTDLGDEKSAESIFEKLLRYRDYFGSDGGVTVSGGEPLMQAEFVYELFSLCRERGIHTALDTSGCILGDRTDRVLSVTDLCLLDYKLTNDADYEKYTRCQKKKVDEFLEKLEDRQIDTWLRQVIVKGINDDTASVQRLYDTAKAKSCVKKVELLKFRKLCESKYKNLGIEFPFSDKEETTDEDIRSILSKVDTYGL